MFWRQTLPHFDFHELSKMDTASSNPSFVKNFIFYNTVVCFLQRNFLAGNLRHFTMVSAVKLRLNPGEYQYLLDEK